MQKNIETCNHLITIAPMVDHSNIFFRNFTRLITKYSPIYTEMIHHNAIDSINPDKFDILQIDQNQHPVILQLGGCDPMKLAEAAKLGEKYGYDEINLNVGCPSPKVQCGAFGACLMKQPQLVAECMKEIINAVSIPVTVKCRLGVDDEESYQFIHNFIEIVSQKGNIKHFVVHARNAILKGLNPIQNRTVPPLKYDYVFRLQKDFPNLKFCINGGIKTVQQAKQLLDNHNLQGCMIGRTAINTPWDLRTIDQVIYKNPSQNFDRRQLLDKYGQWADKFLETHQHASRSLAIKPALNLFAGEKNNRQYKQILSDSKINKGKTLRELFAQAITVLQQQVVNQRKFDK